MEEIKLTIGSKLIEIRRPKYKDFLYALDKSNGRNSNVTTAHLLVKVLKIDGKELKYKDVVELDMDLITEVTEILNTFLQPLKIDHAN